jgi:Protein of unknown function (DUF3530)
MKIFNLFFLFYILMTSAVFASDIAREKRIAEQIVDAIFDGDPVYLTDSSKHSFLSIYMPSDLPVIHGGAIIMHGRGMHPDWKDVTQPLRTELPAYGWNTLSIQMPVLQKSAKYNDYVPIFSEAGPRIEAAIEFMRSKNIDKIVLIAHSCSIHMSMEWLRSNKNNKNIIAYIGIGMGATDYKQPMIRPFPLSELNFPVLDLYGSDDYPAVKRMAPGRLKMIKQAGHSKSAQLVVAGSDHYHKDNNQNLIKNITLWLKKLSN